MDHGQLEVENIDQQLTIDYCSQVTSRFTLVPPLSLLITSVSTSVKQQADLRQEVSIQIESPETPSLVAT